mmetsp:Transcript_4954/g.8170  ORF Transcript_4954/g.8170 Transcript_4954/m.8170 type:complete len:130 (-) Transcript_4954:270-659(-)
MSSRLRDVEEMLQYAAETDPFRVANSNAGNRRRVTAEEARAQLNSKEKVQLWVSSEDDARKNNRRGSADRSECKSDTPRGGRGSSGGAVSTSKRYHARMDAGMLSDEDDSDQYGSYTQSCSSEESAGRG